MIKARGTSGERASRRSAHEVEELSRVVADGTRVEQLLKDRSNLIMLALEAIAIVGDLDNDGARDWVCAAIETLARIEKRDDDC
jgi:hypothetical protein